MAEYYPLLAKAVGSLPNSTPETRRIVYERARKALIGQLKTLHPPVPEEDIDRESVALDRAIERLETELAAALPAGPPAAPGTAETTPAAETKPASPPIVAPAPPRAAAAAPSSALAARKPIAPLRPRMPKPAALAPVAEAPPKEAAATPAVVPPPEPSPEPTAEATDAPLATGLAAEPAAEDSARIKPRLEAQRPIAPQPPPTSQGPKRRMWIIPVGLGAVVLLVALAAWKLRVKPETVAHDTPSAATQQQPENGKIAERVGGAQAPSDQPSDQETQNAPSSEAPQPTTPAPSPQAAAPAPATQPSPTPQAGNPELPVAHRAALLVEAPDLPSKVQTFPGTVVWKLNNVNSGPSDAVGLSVEADIDLPDDKTKAIVTFEKNTDPSLPASHTIKVRFMVDAGSYSGDVKQISVPQMRREGNSDGEPLAGVTVPVIQDSFLVGLSPGNAETANLRLLDDLPWIDIPMLLTNGKIAKLTFEKGASGQRDFNEALAYWQKQ